MFICPPQPRANKQIEVEKHIKHTTGVILNILINVLIKENDGTGAEKCRNVGVFETAAPPLLEVGKRDKICANQRTNEAAILAGKPFTSE